MTALAQAQQTIDRLKSENGDLQVENDQLRLQVRELKAQVYGPKSEKSRRDEPEGQTLLEGVAEAAIGNGAQAAEKPQAPKPPRRSDGRRKGPKPLPAHLRREHVAVADPDLGELICPATGALMKPGFQQTIEVLSRRPAEYYVRAYTRNVFVSPAKEAPVASAWPASVLPKTRVDASVAAWVLSSRFADHLPFHRQQGILRRHGVEISRTTMCGWSRRIEEAARPLVALIADAVLASGYVQLDATPARILDPQRPGAAREACAWAYRALDGPVFFEFAMGKSGKVPKARLERYQGILQTDGASNFGGATEKPGVVHLQCWAHARRYFVKAQKAHEKDAAAYVQEMDRLFRLERICSRHNMDTCRRQRLRERFSIPRAERLFEAAGKWRENCPMRKTAMGRAVDYLLARQDDLMECLRRPGSRIDNNLVENAIRPLKLGLKNYLFIGHPSAGSTFACMYTLVENCRLAGANPEEYFADLIERLLDYPASKLADFIPQNWVKLQKSKNASQ